MSLRATLSAIAATLLVAYALIRIESSDAEPPAAAPTGTSTPAAAPAASAASAPAAADDAAAKHAKRTACLKSAKEKKLVGAQKKAYVKDCTAGP